MTFEPGGLIDCRLPLPYIKGVVGRSCDARPRHPKPFTECLPSERTLTQPNTNRLLSPPSLETCDIFKIEPAFGRLPYGSHRTLLFDEPVAGLPGWQIRRAPFFWLHRLKEFVGISVYPVFGGMIHENEVDCDVSRRPTPAIRLVLERRNADVDSQNGKEFQAEFVKQEGPVVTLKKPDGIEMTVRMGGLSNEDRKYVKQQGNSRTLRSLMYRL